MKRQKGIKTIWILIILFLLLSSLWFNKREFYYSCTICGRYKKDTVYKYLGLLTYFKKTTGWDYHDNENFYLKYINDPHAHLYDHAGTAFYIIGGVHADGLKSIKGVDSLIANAAGKALRHFQEKMNNNELRDIPNEEIKQEYYEYIEEVKKNLIEFRKEKEARGANSQNSR